jgi:predicted SAM-dependent methyltransferase
VERASNSLYNCPMLSTQKLLSSTRVRRIVTRLMRNNSLQHVGNPDLVNLGCGGNVLQGFLNIDYGWRQGVLCWDITRPLPIRSNSVSGIFCEHALEHFEWQTAVHHLLPEMFRILKPGGTVRIAVPDAEYSIDLYIAARDAGKTQKVWNEPHHENPNRLNLTPMGELVNVFRRIYEPYYQGHKFAYDFQTMQHFLFLSGFVDIQRVQFMQGRDPRLLVDFERRRGESLYVEAAKPL